MHVGTLERPALPPEACRHWPRAAPWQAPLRQRRRAGRLPLRQRPGAPSCCSRRPGPQCSERPPAAARRPRCPAPAQRLRGACLGRAQASAPFADITVSPRVPTPAAEARHSASGTKASSPHASRHFPLPRLHDTCPPSCPTHISPALLQHSMHMWLGAPPHNPTRLQPLRTPCLPAGGRPTSAPLLASHGRDAGTCRAQPTLARPPCKEGARHAFPTWPSPYPTAGPAAHGSRGCPGARATWAVSHVAGPTSEFPGTWPLRRAARDALPRGARPPG